MATEYRSLTLRELKEYLFELDITDPDVLDVAKMQLFIEHENSQRVAVVMRNEEIAFFDAPRLPSTGGEYIPVFPDEEL